MNGSTTLLNIGWTRKRRNALVKMASAKSGRTTLPGEERRERLLHHFPPEEPGREHQPDADQHDDRERQERLEPPLLAAPGAPRGIGVHLPAAPAAPDQH